MSSRTANILRALLIFSLSSLFFTSFWVYRTFGVVSLSQTALILVLDLGTGTAPRDATRHFLGWAVVVPAILTGIICASAWLEKRGKRFVSLAVLLLLIPGAIVFSLKENFDFFTRTSPPAATAGNIFDRYKTPPIPSLQRKPLNVIWIFVESLEKDYSDVAINAEVEKATGFMTPLSVGPLVNRFTVGGVMSAKCGAPIYFAPTFAFQLQYSGFNRAICFDDVLRTNGYDSYFVVGHDASRSGFRGYYQKHASAKIYDQKYLESIKAPNDSDIESYPDEKVFETALEILKSPALKKPYAMNILTLDNHSPSGLPSNTCKTQYGTNIRDVIRCDNHYLAKFIEDLHEEGLLQDTVLVVMGDHPYTGNFDQLLPSREIFAKIYTPDSDRKICNNTPSPFDFFPSVLSAMGFNAGRQQYGYGYSFYDVSVYPVKDWKNWLDTFSSASPSDRYKALMK
jgi:phosphoglycerol transferase